MTSLTAARPLRPSDLLAAFFSLGIGFLLVAAAVAGVHAATGWAPGHLAVLARVRDLTRPLPEPRPTRDRSLALLALLAVLTLAAGRASELTAIDRPAFAVLLAVYVVLGMLILSRALRALRGVPRGVWAR